MDVGGEDSSPCRLWDPWNSWLAEEAVLSTGRGHRVVPVVEGAPEELLLAYPQCGRELLCMQSSARVVLCTSLVTNILLLF